MASGITHPFNPQLPPEVCSWIFELAVGGKIREVGYPSPLELGGWRRVNKSWNSYLTPLLYSSFVYHGNPNKIAGLWSFLRLVVMDAEKAAYVRQLTFTAMEMELEFNPKKASDVLFEIYKNVVDVWFNGPIADVSDLDEVGRQLNETYLTAHGRIKLDVRTEIRDLYYRALFQKNRHWLSDVMHDIGFDQAGHLGEGMHERADRILFKSDPYSGYHCPLVAIILAHCPNLRELNMQVWPSKEDRWLNVILGDATERWPGTSLSLKTRPLQQLRYLAIAPKPDRSFADTVTNSPCVIDDHRPYFRLPRLEEFSALHTEIAKSVFETKTPSKITALAINGPELDKIRLPKVLALTPNIRYLSLSIAGDAHILQTGVPHKTHLRGPALYTELWKALLPLKDQLEYLDLHQGHMHDYDYRTWFLERPDIAVCPPLAKFTKLRQLNVPLLVLAGHNCTHGDTSLLTAHLPPHTLESLGLYTGGAGHLDKYTEDYERCLAEIVPAATHLRVIVLDNSMSGAPNEPQLHDTKLERAARKRGIWYTVNAGDYLFYGGWETPFGQACVRGRTGRDLQRIQFVRDDAPRWVVPVGMKVFGFEGRLSDQRGALYPNGEAMMRRDGIANGRDSQEVQD
ncbi:hypothetical protein BJY01DRAFT_254508 [Aspergillus pseudoustus]|uniref:F-box domain-containing protein n=1 Tax=Aspergillus pseudoustus TaxID=1810923 RepID=A0ABR4IV26_9EURO